VAHKKESR